MKVGGNLIRSCLYPVAAVGNQPVETIEGLNNNAVQKAWVDIDVPQCGYCQSGMIMAATDLLEKNPSPTDEDIDQAITNICRCGTYSRIRTAIHQAAGKSKLADHEAASTPSETDDLSLKSTTLFYDASTSESF